MILVKANGFLCYSTPDNWINVFTGKRPAKAKRKTAAQKARAYRKEAATETVRRTSVEWRINRLDYNLAGQPYDLASLNQF